MSNNPGGKNPATAKLNPILHNLHAQVTENFKRPLHPDFMTTEELKKLPFTGLRQNEIAQQVEFWIVGEIVASVTFAEMRSDPFAVAKMQAQYGDFKGE